MSDFGKRLAAAENPQSRGNQQSNSAIFGSLIATDVSTVDEYRIGLLPWRWSTQPKVAMGLMVLLSFLFRRRQGITVYPVMAAVEGEPESYTWEIDKSQFVVDDWYIDDLDDNIGIWAEIKSDGPGLQLNISVESDLLENDSVRELSYVAENLSQLIGLLPDIHRDIEQMHDIEYEDDAAITDVFTSVELVSNHHLQEFLTSLFEWERNVYLSVWGIDWLDEEIADDLQLLLDTAANCGRLGEWATVHAMRRTLKPGYGYVADIVAEEVPAVIDQLSIEARPATLLAPGLFSLGFAERALNILQDEIERAPDQPRAWIQLALIQQSSGALTDSIVTLQAAIRDGHVSPALYETYGDMLRRADEMDMIIHDYILLDSDDLSTHEDPRVRVLMEAADAYYIAHEDTDPIRLSAVYKETIARAGAFDVPAVWDCFADLVEEDQTGDLVSEAITSFYELDDLSEAIAVLENAVSQKPGRVDLAINLAQVYMLDGNYERAAIVLENVLGAMSADDERMPLVERLLIWARHPDYEQRFAETSALILAGGKPSDREIDMLETIVDEAPHFPDGYVTLARAYLTFDQASEALELLLDGRDQCGDDPFLIMMLSDVLWQAGEHKLAEKYVTEAITNGQRDAGLLATLAKMQFDSNNLDIARELLAQAEAIEPRNSVLQRVKSYVARHFDANS